MRTALLSYNINKHQSVIAKYLVKVLTVTSLALLTPMGVSAPAQAVTDTTFDAGAYVIDAGALSAGAVKQTLAQGIKPYGLVYALIKAKIPVQWVIKQDKAAISQTAGNADADFTFDCDGSAGSTYATKNYRSGAFIITKEYAAQAASIVSTWKAKGVVVDGPCSNTLPTLPVYSTLKSWPRVALDAQNGAVAVTYFNNAEIPQGSTTDPLNPPTYRFVAPSALTPCDDIYVMPHADPTYATHSNLINFVKAGGDFYASCHAVSVVENMVATPGGDKVMNFLSTNGLLNYDAHSQGSLPYKIYDTSTASAYLYTAGNTYYSTYNNGSTTAAKAGPFSTTYTLPGLKSGDPIAQFLGVTDAAQQQGSEQIFMPAADSRWRPTTQLVVINPTQTNTNTNYNGATTLAAGKTSYGPAASVLYGPAFGNSNYGHVMYVGGHSSAKGTADDVAAQRIFFNFLLLSATKSSDVPADTDRTPTVTMDSISNVTLQPGQKVDVSGNAVGGSGTFRYKWSATCNYADGSTYTFATSPFDSDTSNSATFTAPDSMTNVAKCNLTLTAIDTCGRYSFGYQTFALAPKANVKVEVTPATNGTIVNTFESTYLVTNINTAGNSAAGEVSLRIPLPSGTTYQSHVDPVFSGTAPAGAVCTLDTGVLTCDLKTLLLGQTATVKLSWKTNAAGTYTSEASVSTSSVDVVLSNNRDAKTTDVTIGSPTPLVKVRKSPISQNVTSSGTAAFRLEVENQSSGGIDLTNVSIVDTVTTNGTLSCYEDASLTPLFTGNGPTSFNYTISKIVAGGTWVVGCEIVGLTSSGSNTLSASYSGAQGSTTDSTTSTITVTPSLKVEKDIIGTVQVGSRITYSVVVTNNTGGTVTNVQIDDPLQTGVLAVPSSANISKTSTGVASSDRNGVLAYDKFTGASRGTTSITSSNSVGWASTTWTTGGTGASSSTTITSYTSSSTLSTNKDSIGIALAKKSSSSSTGLTYFFSRDITLTSNDSNVAILFECAASSSNQKFSVTLGLKVWSNLSCSSTRSQQVLNASKALVGNTPSTGTYTLRFDLQSSSSSSTRYIIFDDIYVVANLVSTDSVFQSTSGTKWSSGTGWVDANWTENTDASSKLDPINITSSSGDGSVGSGTAMKFNPTSGTAVTSTIERNFTIDATKYASAKLRVALRHGNLSSGYFKVFLGNTSGSAIFTSQSDTGTSWTQPRQVDIALTPAGAQKLIFQFYGDQPIWLDDVIMTASPAGVAAATNIKNANLADALASTFTLLNGDYLALTFDVNIDKNFPNPSAAGLVNLAKASGLMPNNTTVTSYGVHSAKFVSPGLTVTKTSASATISSGSNVTYNYTIKNTGEVALSSVALSDPKCTPSGAATTLAVGASTTASCTINNVTSDITGDTATVTVSANDPSSTAITPATAIFEVLVLNPAISVTSTPTPKTVYVGSGISYNYAVTTSTGNSPLKDIAITVENCSSIHLDNGDDNGDMILQTSETWNYVCTTDPLVAAATANKQVAVNGKSIYSPYTTVYDTRTVSVTVLNRPVLTLTKSVRDSVSGNSGSAITVTGTNGISYYETLTVTNVPLHGIKINNTGCNMTSATKSGDTGSDGTLGTSETWTYICSAGTLSATETAQSSAFGIDSEGNKIYSNTVETTVTVEDPTLEIEIRPEKLYVAKTKSNTYKYIIKNTGGVAFNSLTGADTNCPSLQSKLDGKSLPVGGIVTVACTVTNFQSDLTSTFTLTGNYTGGSKVAAPSVVTVFVINPTFEIKKYVKAYATGVDTSTVLSAGFSDTTTAVTVNVTDTVFFRYEVKAAKGTGATNVEGLNSLLFKSFQDSECINLTARVDSNGYNVGDTNGSGYIDPNETWHYVCRAVSSVTAYRAPGTTFLRASTKFKASTAVTPQTYALKTTAPLNGWFNALGDTTTSTVTIGVISSLDDPNAIDPTVSLTGQSSVTINVIDPGTTATYTVTYDGNGNTGGSAPSPQSATNGSTVTASSNSGNLVRDGYTFGGWNTKPDGTGTTLTAGSTQFVMPAGNVTLYAIWTSITQFHVYYDGNENTGGTAPSDGTGHLGGASVSVLGNSGTLTRTGYTFVGWNTTAGGTGNHYATGGSLTMPNSDVTLYAEWVIDSELVVSGYNVTYDGNGNTSGSVPTDANTYANGASVTVSGNAGALAKTGYTLSSWNTAANGSGTSYATSGSATFNMASSNVTLYAIWTANSGGGGGSTAPVSPSGNSTYKVKYDLNGSTSGTVPIDPTNYPNGSTVTVLNNGGNLSRTGFTFGGWSTSPNGGTNYSPNGTFPMPNSDVILYPIWIANQTSKIIYEANGAPEGTVPVDSKTYGSNSNGTVLGNTGNLYRRGYTFNGWNTAANGAGTSYAPGATVNIGNTGVILFAQWKALPAVTITYNAGSATGGSMPTDTNKYYQLDVAKIQTNLGNLTRAGYKFIGWNTAADGTGTVYPATGNAVLVIGTTNVNLYPEWEKIAVPGSNVKQGKMVFKVFFGMNSVAIDAIAKKNIKEHFIIMKSKMTAKSKVTITVEGWVQPNNPPGNITYLSTNRAKNVTAAIKALGLKGTYRLSFPGLAPLNDAKSRYAEVIFTWTDSK